MDLYLEKQTSSKLTCKEMEHVNSPISSLKTEYVL